MATTFQTNENNDIFIGKDGNLAIISDIEALVQQIKEAIEVLRDEPIYDKSLGVDYENTVFKGSPNVVAFERQARDQILRIDGVIRIISFEPVVENDVLSYTSTIKTIYGTEEVDGGISI